MAPGGPVEALVAMKERGLAASIGISGGPVGMLQQFVETDIFDALVTHNRYTLVDRSGDALLNAAAARNLGIDNAAVYGGGILTGDARFAGSYGYAPIRPAVQAAVDAIAALCREAGVSLAAAALQFSLRDPRIHSTIVGVTSLDRFDDLERESAESIPDGFWDAVDAALPPASAALDA
jgi:D-threo-aldose 1-dehydrogenase